MPGIIITLGDAFRSPANFSGDNRNKQIVVGGWAEELPVDPDSDHNLTTFLILEALKAQYGIVVQPTGSAHPVDGSLLVSNISIRGTSHNTASISIVYQYPTGFAPTVLVWEMDTVERQVQSSRDPKTGLPMMVAWDGRDSPGDDPSEGKGARIPADAVSAPFSETITTISATISRQGFLTDDVIAEQSGNVGVANDAIWFKRPPGSWKMTRYKASISSISGYYSIAASAMTRSRPFAPFNDWRRLITLHSYETGRSALPSIDKLTRAIAAPYVFGLINRDGPHGPGADDTGLIYDPLKDGFRVDGPFPVVSYPKLWSLLVAL